MAIAYTVVVPNPAGVPDSVEVHVTAMRRDGKPLSGDELAAIAAAYPPPVEAARAHEAPPVTAAKAKRRKPAAKRAAARRPSAAKRATR